MKLRVVLFTIGTIIEIAGIVLIATGNGVPTGIIVFVVGYVWVTVVQWASAKAARAAARGL